jgi:hypothetical protein
MTSRRDVLAGAAAGTALALHVGPAHGAAAATVGIGWFADRAAATAAKVAPHIATLAVASYAQAQDGGGALYVRRSGTAAGLPLAFKTTDGAEWTWDPTQRIRVTMFGADAAGTRPASAGIQAAVDFCLRAGLQQCWVPEGTYLIDETIHLGYGETFQSLSLVGECERGAYGGHMQGVRFRHLRADGPVINVQGARNSTVRGIGFAGCGPGDGHSYLYHRISGVLFNPATFNVSPDPADWLDRAHIPNGLDRYRPYAAITIDAYSGARPAQSYPDVAHPVWTGINAQWNKAPSSAVKIKDCSFRGFAAVLATAPSGSDGNGDFVSVADCSWEYCIYGITINHTQSRNVAIRDCRYGYCHTAISNRAFGRQTGKIGGPIDNLSGGQGYQIFDLLCAGANGTIVLRNCYAEGFVRIGRWGHGYASFLNAVRFEGCEFGFNHHGPQHGGAARYPAWLLQCDSPVTPVFANCMLGTARFATLAGPRNRGVVIENLVAVTGRDYALRINGAFMSEALAAAYNSCGGVFVNDPSGSGSLELRGMLEASGFERMPSWASGSRRLSRVVDRSGQPKDDMVAHPFAETFVDATGRRWPIAHHVPATPIPANSWVSAAKIEGMVLTGRIRGDLIERVDPLNVPEPGDLLYEDATENLYAVTQVARDPASVHYVLTAELQNNYRYTGPDFGVPTFVAQFAASGYCWLYKAAPRVSQTVWWGDFAEGSREVRNIHRGDGFGGSCADPGELRAGMRVVLPAGFSERKTRSAPARLSASLVSVANGADGAPGTATLDRSAQRTGRFPVSPIVSA